MITKDLGLVTAYAYAVSGGYTGTEAEFTELLGSIAKDLEEIEGLSVTVETLPPGSGATASYADGVLHLGIPRGDKGEKGDKGDKGDKGETGETGPQGPKGDPGDVSTEQLDEAISGVRTEMEESYARNDGYYEEMTVGDAEQLISTQFVEDSDPYLFRPTGGSADVGNREYLDKIVGGTVGWNQLVNHESKTNRGITATYDSETHIYTLSGTSTGTYAELFGEVNVLAGHKYLCGGRIVSNPNSININVRILARMTKYIGNHPMTIGIGSTNGTSNQGIDGFTVDTDFTGVKLQYCCFDLTAMFGTTIADYIYSLEAAHAGDGVAWFRRYFPKDYYPYDPGTLRSVEGVSAHETVGFNQWDESLIGDTNTNYGYFEIPIGKTNLLNMTLQDKDVSVDLSGVYFGFFVNSTDSTYGYRWIISNGSVQSNKTNRSSNNILCSYLVVYPNTEETLNKIKQRYNICINLSDPTRNGEYEPYQKHTYPLDSSLTLRGVPKLADGKLAFDGDIYPPSGEVQRRYGLRAYQSGDESLTDAITDGTNTVYKLATPATETADGYEQYQICDPSGTEEFVTTGIVPVGHETRYPANLRDKLQHLPDLPSPLLGGTYIIVVNGSQMRLEKFLIPEAPATDGTYTLKATVSGGNPTYTWEVEA